MRRCFLSLALLTLALGCADEGEAQRRLDDIRTAYSAAIKQDFVSGLHGEEVARVLRALDQFEGPDKVRDEAIALAARIRRTQARNPIEEEALRAEDVFDGAGEEALPQLASADPTEAIWMKALQVGSFRADFERYWLGCFQPVGGDAERWRVVDLPPCRKRPGLERIAEVRFRDGQISELLTHQQIVNQASPP